MVTDEWELGLVPDESLDLLFVTYDAGQVGVDKILETITEHGFEGEVQ